MYDRIKPIPTKYKKVSYKSKLEAQWALYLEKLHLKFIYEPQSFKLGTRLYTPDFLIENRLFIEVKPEVFTLDTLDKITLLATMREIPVALCAGDFYKSLHIAIVSPGGNFTFGYEFRYCPNCKATRLINTTTCPDCYHSTLTFDKEWMDVKKYRFR